MTAKEILKRYKAAISYQEEYSGSLPGAPDEGYKRFMEELKRTKKA